MTIKTPCGLLLEALGIIACFERRISTIAFALLMSVSVPVLHGEKCQFECLLLDTGMNGHVNTLVVFNDGSGPGLYAAGNFTQAGGNAAHGIAKWDGAAWSPLGAGMDGARCFDLIVFDDGSGPALYAAGSFTQAGDTMANGIAKWDGADWSPLGAGVRHGLFVYIMVLAVFDDGSGPALYAGGEFLQAGEIAANGIAKWNGADWSALDAGASGGVLALAVFDDGSGTDLYAGGGFTRAGKSPANGIARWDGEEWSPLDSGVNSSVNRALTVFDDGRGSALYAGGYFTQAGEMPANFIARWDGEAWSPLAIGAGLNGSVSALTVFDDGGGPALYAAGSFTEAGGKPASHIAKWNGVFWSPLGAGVNDTVNVLTVFDDGSGPAIYAGGEFTEAGGNPANYIAKWDGTVWSPVGGG
ncbi:MAG: hypothetical protein ACNA8P_09055 [Phycisphaerales bacterium]